MKGFWRMPCGVGVIVLTLPSTLVSSWKERGVARPKKKLDRKREMNEPSRCLSRWSEEEEEQEEFADICVPLEEIFQERMLGSPLSNLVLVLSITFSRLYKPTNACYICWNVLVLYTRSRRTSVLIKHVCTIHTLCILPFCPLDS